MFCITLYRLDQIGDEVVALFEVGIQSGERFLCPVPRLHKVVVGTHCINHKNEQKYQDCNQCDDHREIFTCLVSLVNEMKL